MSLATTLIAGIRAQLAGASDHGAPQSDERLDYSKSLANGTGASQADKVFSDRRTLAASANETLDLTNLQDPLGAALTFAKVKAIMIVAALTNANDVVIGAAAANPFLGPLGGTGPIATLKPGGIYFVANPVNGWAVTDSSNDNLKIANSAGGSGVDYDIVIIGTSA